MKLLQGMNHIDLPLVQNNLLDSSDYDVDYSIRMINTDISNEEKIIYKLTKLKKSKTSFHHTDFSGMVRCFWQSSIFKRWPNLYQSSITYKSYRHISYISQSIKPSLMFRWIMWSKYAGNTMSMHVPLFGKSLQHALEYFPKPK